MKDKIDMNSECLCYELRRTSRAITRLYDSFFADTGLTYCQYSLLYDFLTLSAKPATEVANAISSHRSTINRLVKPLLAKGFLESIKLKDKRVAAYVITKQGRQKVDDLHDNWESAKTEVTALIGAADYNKILGGLHSVLQSMDIR
jgi:DNA-binding MarR family transcriptional regulator